MDAIACAAHWAGEGAEHLFESLELFSDSRDGESCGFDSAESAYKWALWENGRAKDKARVARSFLEGL